MDFINDAKEIFESLWRKISGRSPLSNILVVEEKINRWLSIYQGKATWLSYQYASLNGYKMERKRRTLNMAKVICREISALVWAENPIIDAGENSLLNTWIQDNNLFNRGQKYTEIGAAMGGYAMKLRAPDTGGLVVDFVPADCFVPVSWGNDGIYEADFISRRTEKGKSFLSVESHRKLNDSQYEITVTEGEEDGTIIKNQREISRVGINTRVPLFVYVPTPEVNNIDIDSSLGVSLFANAEDTLQSLDIAFDALGQEIILGKRRIIVPATAVKKILNPRTGKEERYFDPSDEAFVAFNLKDAQEQKILDNTVEMRIEEIVSAIKALLDILATQTGFSTGSFSFDGASVKTATEVISENAKTFKLKQNYENQITYGLQKLFAALREIGASYQIAGIPEIISITWNDSIIEDRDSRSKYWNDRYLNGTATLEDVLVNVDGYTREDATKKADEIRGKKSTVDVSNIFGGVE